MELKWKIHEWNFNPTLTQLQTEGPTKFGVMDVHRGTWVKGVAMRVGIAFDSVASALVGDGDVGEAVPNIGFMTYLQAAITEDGLKNGANHYLDQGLAGIGANGKLYTEDDVIGLYYTGGTEVTKGQLSVIVVYAEIE